MHARITHTAAAAFIGLAFGLGGCNDNNSDTMSDAGQDRAYRAESGRQSGWSRETDASRQTTDRAATDRTATDRPVDRRVGGSTPDESLTRWDGPAGIHSADEPTPNTTDRNDRQR